MRLLTLFGAVALAGLMAGSAVRAQPGRLPASGATGTIVATALDPERRTLPDTRLRLRNVEGGNLERTGVTNGEGVLTLDRVPTGVYLLEMTLATGAVVAVSDVITVTAGQTVRAVVQMAPRSRSFAWWLGSSTTLALAQAASLGVLAVDGGQPVSPQ